MKRAIISHPDCSGHDVGNNHRERPERMTAIYEQWAASGMADHFDHYQAPKVSREQLLRVHTPEYVDSIYAQAPTADGVVVALDEDTAMMNGSLAAVERAAGAGVMAVDMVLSDQHRQLFCAVRPPGHHAEKDRAMGFCVFNSVAVAAAHALEHHGLERVAIVDFDVHHGNGSENMFGGDQRVLFCSSFEHPLYPFSGVDNSDSNVVNIPLAPGTDGATFEALVNEHWLPRLAAFEPQLILVSAGFDAHTEDDISTINLTEQNYHWITTKLLNLADKTAAGRLVSMLEGGYNLSALGRSVDAHLDALLGR